MVGQLASLSSIILPGLAVAVGIAVPALINSYINQGGPIAMRGWAIPAATDIVLAMFIPLSSINGSKSLLERMEHDLLHAVAFIILPIFALANAGVNLVGLSARNMLAPTPSGIALGLLLGKQFGICGIVWLSVKVGIAKLSNNLSWTQICGLSVLCGIGVTMSLFISSLAFESAGPVKLNERLGIIVGSMISAVFGCLILLFFSAPVAITTKATES